MGRLSVGGVGWPVRECSVSVGRVLMGPVGAACGHVVQPVFERCVGRPCSK